MTGEQPAEQTEPRVEPRLRPSDGPVIPDRAAEDSPQAWGDDGEGPDANDERLLRDRPPHW